MSHPTYKPSLRFVLRLKVAEGGGGGAYLWDTMVNDLRCYRVKTEDSEKTGSRQESNPGHLCGVQLTATAGLFTFFYFQLVTSKFIYFQCEARYS